MDDIANQRGELIGGVIIGGGALRQSIMFSLPRHLEMREEVGEKLFIYCFLTIYFVCHLSREKLKTRKLFNNCKPKFCQPLYNRAVW